MSPSSFPKLFERLQIGRLGLKNRLVMLPMGTAYASPSGEVTQRTIDYFAERARGGVGLITVGNISPHLPNVMNQLVLSSDWVLMGHFELVEKVHAHGSKIAAQLNHAGKQKYTESRLPGEELISSSPLPTSFLGEVYPVPRPLSKGEIYEMIEKFSRASERAKKVGYDAVEIHGAHGYLINQFISPFMNKRMDEFGGSLENRMKFPLELIKAVRQAVGPEFPIGFRLSAEEFVPGGITLEESTVIAKMLESAGVAYLSVTVGVYDTAHKMIDLMPDPEGWKELVWEGIKKAVKIPTLAGGGLRHPDFCERLLKQGKADLIGLARPLFADPEWPRKAMAGKVEEIRPCISCNECMAGSGRRRRGGGGRYCTVNPAAGREREFADTIKAASRKKVMVIGGGPAGMEAARIASLRGHQVTLYEKGGELGGQLLMAGTPQRKRKIWWFRDYLMSELNRLNVETKLGIEVTPSLIEKEKPNAVIVATGAEPILPAKSNFSTGKVLKAWDLLSRKIQYANEAIVIVGGGMVGCEAAEYLLETGNKVTILEQLPSLGHDMEPFHRFIMLAHFREHQVIMLNSRKVVGVDERGVRVIHLGSNEEEFLEADRVIVAVGTTPVDGLSNALEGKVEDLYSVGDCNGPRVIMEAVYEGSLAGRQID